MSKVVEDEIEVPDHVTHYRVRRLNRELGAWEVQKKISPTGAEFTRWKVPEPRSGFSSFILPLIRERWGPGAYRIQWIAPSGADKRLRNAGTVDLGIPGEPSSVPIASGPPAPASVAAAAPPLAMPFPPLDGFRALFSYAKDIRREERTDAQSSADRYRADVDLMMQRERQAFEAHQKKIELESAERIAEMKIRHDREVAQYAVTLRETQKQVSAAPDANEAILARLDELAEEIGETKETVDGVGGKVVGILESLIKEFGVPLAKELAKAAGKSAVGN